MRLTYIRLLLRTDGIRDENSFSAPVPSSFPPQVYGEKKEEEEEMEEEEEIEHMEKLRILQ